MSALRIILKVDGEPMPPLAPWPMERWDDVAMFPDEPMPPLVPSMFSGNRETMERSPIDTRGLHAWRKEEFERRFHERETLLQASKQAGAKLRTTYAKWAVPGVTRGPPGRNYGGILGGPDAAILVHAVVSSLATVGAAATFLKYAKDVLKAYIRRPRRTIEVAEGKIKIAGAQSEAELDRLIDRVERMATTLREMQHAQGEPPPLAKPAKRGTRPPRKPTRARDAPSS